MMPLHPVLLALHVTTFWVSRSRGIRMLPGVTVRLATVLGLVRDIDSTMPRLIGTV
jgi:hypothetical protein